MGLRYPPGTAQISVMAWVVGLIISTFLSVLAFESEPEVASGAIRGNRFKGRDMLSARTANSGDDACVSRVDHPDRGLSPTGGVTQ